MTDRYAVIGNPVSHSLSPRIHARFAAATRQDLSYGKLQAPTGGFAAAAERFFADGGRGLNVTLPFKTEAWRWVASHDQAASVAGAVNTVVLQGGATQGCNTDGSGLVADLAGNLGWPLSGARVLLLGAGGAAQGVVLPLAKAGAALTIANRTRQKAEGLAERLDAFATIHACGLDEIGGGWDLIVNATSASVGGDVVPLAPQAAAGARCYDMFYALEGETAFCRWARTHGALAAADGLGMLVEQAADAFALWRGVRPATVGVVDALRRGDCRAAANQP